jgi:hypothetical protein
MEAQATEQTTFSGWAKVEVMGHQVHVGKVTTQAFGQAVLFRIDSPEIPEREETMATDRWTGQGHFPKGSTVKHAAIAAVTVLVGSHVIFRITPCTEEMAIQEIILGTPAPLSLVSGGPRKALLTQGREDDDDDDDDDDDGFRSAGEDDDDGDVLSDYG